MKMITLGLELKMMYTWIDGSFFLAVFNSLLDNP
jgi:hypothetical protein